jgi:hypothetical protein
VAEEVAKVYPELVSYGPDGKPMTVHYLMLSAMLLNELQKQASENHRLAAENQRSAAENQRLAAQVRRLSAQMVAMKTSIDRVQESMAALKQATPARFESRRSGQEDSGLTRISSAAVKF